MNFTDPEEDQPASTGTVYYTIYLKGLANGSGYLDVALADEQLFKDYLQYLDVGIKPVRKYVVTMPPTARGKPVASTGLFAINLSEVAAMMTETCREGSAA